MRVSVSKLKKWRRCPNAYRYKYVEGWTPRMRALALERGTWIHALLEEHYNGRSWKKKHKQLTKKFNSYFEEQREELGDDLPEVCANIMQRYLKRYPDDMDRYWVIDTELDEIVTLPNGLEVQVIIDLVLEDKQTGGIWLWDHKTRKKFQTSTQHMLDPQLTIYHACATLLGYTPLVGICINELSTKLPTRPKMTKTTGKLERRTNIVCDPATYMEEIKRHKLPVADYSKILAHLAVAQKDTFFKRNYMPKDPPVIKTMMREAVQTAEEIMAAEKRNRFPRTYNASQCAWDCDYKDICLTELHGGDPREIVKAAFETKDQRKARERRERIIGEVKRVARSD